MRIPNRLRSRAAPIEILEGRIAPATFVWDGGGGDSAWENALNWDLDSGFPGFFDAVVLAIPSTIDTSGVLRQVASFTQSDGTLTGADPLLVRETFTWTGGTQSGAGNTIVFGEAIISGAAVKTLDDRGLAPQGDSRVQLSGSLSLANGGVADFYGTTTIDGALTVAGTAGTAFINHGTMSKTGPAAATFAITAVNNGDFFARDGSVEFGGAFFQDIAALLPPPSFTLAGGEVTFSGTPAQFQAGFLRGFGMITGSIVNSGATISPGGQTPGGLALANLNLADLSGANGFKISGVAAGDQSGRSVSGAGDINGDGIDDVIIGAFRADPNGSYSGASYVVFGSSGGFAANVNLAGLTGADGFTLSGLAADDNSGQSVSGAGDINGDGIDDLIIGARGANANGTNSGASYVVFGSSGGFAANVNLAALTGGNGFKISGAASFDYSGIAVSGAGDINGDGIDDLIVGAYRADPNGNYSGASYVVFGSSGGFAANLNLAGLTGANGFKLSGVTASDLSGYSVSDAGDVNGDGIDDLIIGALFADANGYDSGASYVVFGSRTPFAANLNLSGLTGANGFKLSGVAAGDQSGISVSGAGDVNGDGIDDLIIGAYHADLNGNRSGASYVVFGSRGGFAANVNLAGLTGADGFKLSGGAIDDYAGFAVSGAGDINGDGIDDFIVGAYGADPNGGRSGASYVVFGSRGGFAANLNLSGLTGASGFKISGAAAGDQSGNSVSGAGDINGDGIDDLIIGAYLADPNGSNSGASYVVFGSSGIGTLAITGDYTQGVVGRLAIELGGAANGEFDALLVGGTALLDGAVRGNLFGGYTPASGTFTFLSAGTRSATFASDDLQPPLTLGYIGETAFFNVASALDPLVVNSTLDLVDGGDAFTTLREAILFANGNAGLDTITFAVPGGGVQTIAPTSALPTITDAVVIDGTSQPGASANTNGPGLGSNAALLLVLSGASAGFADGLVLAAGSDGSTIHGLVINGWQRDFGGGVGGSGIVVRSDGNVIAGNFIGTNAAGSAALPNALFGVSLEPGASGTIIGGSTPGARNVISGNNIDGVYISGPGTDGTVIAGNFIGTDAAGTADLGNLFQGIELIGGPANTTIGGATAAERNVISGNNSMGIFVQAGTNGLVVRGNFLGTDVTGMADLGNNEWGILVLDSPNVSIGGTGVGNVISGNGNPALPFQAGNWGIGVTIDGAGSTGARVEGNLIGLNATGTAAIPNRGGGLDIKNNAPLAIVGGATAGARNVISGNTFDGITVLTGASATIRGNYLGTDLTGTVAIGNETGIYVADGASAQIGGATAAERNLIAGGNYGIYFYKPGGGTRATGNFIGTDVTGTLALGSAIAGVAFDTTDDVLLGDLGSGEGNVISGNAVGIVFSNDGTGTTNNNEIIGNLIGTQPDGVTPLGNAGAGINLGGGTTGTRIGSIGAGGNVIAFNGGPGVVSEAASATGNTIRGNSIHSNGGLGIDLGNDGPTPNDAGDGDSGPNALLNFPEFTATRENGGTLIRGTYNGAANATFTLDFYHDSEADASGFGEGRTPLGSLLVTTDASGEAEVEVSLAAPGGGVISATANDAAGNTSEFSAAVPNLTVTVAPNERTVTFTDIDGDFVTVKVSKGGLKLADFVAQEINGQLVITKIDLTTRPAFFEGANISISAKTPRGGTGNGRVDVQEIDATGINLGKLSIDGNVDIIRAGSGVAGRLGLKTLDAYSIGLGADDGSLLRSGPRVGGGIVLVSGGIGSMRVSTDVSAAFNISGADTAGIRNTRIGGSVMASSFVVPAKMDVIKVLRDITETSFRVGNSIDRLAVTGDITDSQVRIGGTLKSLSVGGDVIDSEIFAPGPVPKATTKRITAIGVVNVKGDFVRSELRAGYDENAAAATGDAGIGSVTVRGNFEAGSIIAGAAAGADGLFGTDDDGVIAGGSAAIVARIASITIKGAVLGTAGDAGDAFGIVAEEIGKIKIGTTSLLLTKGAGNDLARLPLPGADDVFAREVV